jgi:hypothetical protein
VLLLFLSSASAEEMTWKVGCTYDRYGSREHGSGTVSIPINNHTQHNIVNPYLNSSLPRSSRECLLYTQLLENGPNLTNFVFEDPPSSSASSTLQLAGFIQLLVLGVLFS